MPINKLFEQQSAWLRGSGADSDIVISSRIRLARNLNGFLFAGRATDEELGQIIHAIKTAASKIFAADSVAFIELDQCPSQDRMFLLERQLISRELAESERPCAVLFDLHEDFSVMVNEEDHLRIQVMESGLELQKLWQRINDLDNCLEKELAYAYDARIGYLTACPSNVGTGMRGSVMLHLPALVELGEIESVFRSSQKTGFVVRGIYGESSVALGEFFQLSNQITLGWSESELLRRLTEMTQRILQYERKARAYLLEQCSERLLDKCFRALALVRTARTMTFEEALDHLSSIRLGINLGLVPDLTCGEVNKFLLHTLPAHLKKLAGRELDPEEDVIQRAEYFRKNFADGEENHGR